MKPLACYKYGKGKNGVYINTPPLSEAGAKYLVTLLDKSKNGIVELYAIPDGFKLVPIIPTKRQSSCGESEINVGETEGDPSDCIAENTYEVMVEVALKIEDIQL